MADNSNQTFTENQFKEETTSSVYEHSEEENSSTSASTNFSDRISFDENDLLNESITNELFSKLDFSWNGTNGSYFLITEECLDKESYFLTDAYLCT